MNEEWRDIIGYEGRYQVSSNGRVKSLAREVKAPNGNVRQLPELVMRPVNHYRGYLVVFLSREGKKVKFFIHRLVATAFIPNPEGVPVVNHRHGDKKNNCVAELAWATYSENTQHYYRGVDAVEDKEMAF